jgi:hypothetical protein
VFHILKKERKRKKKASAKQKRAAQKIEKNQKCGCSILPSLRTYPILPRLKLVQSGLSILSDFTKPANLSDFIRAENWSVLPDFIKAANLSIFTRAENWSDLACPFCPILLRLRTCPILPGLKTGPFCLILPRLITCQFLPGLQTCPVFPWTENLSNSSSCLSSKSRLIG